MAEVVVVVVVVVDATDGLTAVDLMILVPLVDLYKYRVSLGPRLIKDRLTKDPVLGTAGTAAGWSTSMASDIIRIQGVRE